MWLNHRNIQLQYIKPSWETIFANSSKKPTFPVAYSTKRLKTVHQCSFHLNIFESSWATENFKAFATLFNVQLGQRSKQFWLEAYFQELSALITESMTSTWKKHVIWAVTKTPSFWLFSFSHKGINKSYFWSFLIRNCKIIPKVIQEKTSGGYFMIHTHKFCGSCFWQADKFQHFFFGSPWITCGRYGMLLVAFALLLSLTLALQEPGWHKSLHKEGLWGLLICWWTYPPSYMDYNKTYKDPKINQQHQPTASTIQDIMEGKVTVGHFVITTFGTLALCLLFRD